MFTGGFPVNRKNARFFRPEPVSRRSAPVTLSPSGRDPGRGHRECILRPSPASNFEERQVACSEAAIFDKSKASKHQHRAAHKRPGERAGPRQAQNPARYATSDDRVTLFGLHAVEAALKNPQRKVHRLVLTENAERRLIEAAGPLTQKIERASPRDLDRMLGSETVHQGALLETDNLPEPDFESLFEAAAGRPLIVLDQVTDPHNVGAILRSAAVFGAAGLVMTRRHSPPLNGVVAKSASGALELVPIALVGNLARALDDLKHAGFFLIGLDGGGNVRLEDTDWSQPTALVMGAEGKGLRSLTASTCDQLARITTEGKIASLNVSNAAAIALHTAMIARQG